MVRRFLKCLNLHNYLQGFSMPQIPIGCIRPLIYAYCFEGGGLESSSAYGENFYLCTCSFEIRCVKSYQFSQIKSNTSKYTVASRNFKLKNPKDFHDNLRGATNPRRSDSKTPSMTSVIMRSSHCMVERVEKFSGGGRGLPIGGYTKKLHNIKKFRCL